MTGGANDRSTTIRKFANTDRQKVRRFGHTRRGIRRSSTPQPHYAPLSMADKNGGVGGCSFADRLAGLPGNLLLLPPSTIAEMKKIRKLGHDEAIVKIWRMRNPVDYPLHSTFLLVVSLCVH